MYDQNLGKPVNCDVLFHFINGLALGALVSTLLHPLRSNKVFQAVIEVQATHGILARDGERQVHEAIKGQTLIAALLALNLATELTLKQVSNYGVVSLLEVLVPDL